MKIVADDKIPWLRGVFEPFAEVVYLPGKKISPADVADADALIVRTRTVCGRDLLAGSKVRVVATATIGFDHIKTEELETLSIPWYNAPGCNAGSVKNYIASALSNFGCDLTGRTLGIIGVGNVGKLVAEVGRAFGMKLLLNDPPRADKEGAAGFVQLDELLRESDIVTMHVPLEKSGKYPTVDMADEKFFRAMKPGSCYFNSCRGEVVVPSALKSALQSGKISCALMDVWPGEPNIDPELAALIRFGTPHIAGYSKDGKANGTAAAVRCVSKALGIKELYDFTVETLPKPVFDETIMVDGNAPVWQQLNQAVLHTYDIMDDVKAFYSNISGFEELRGSYWNRREFPAYTVCGASQNAKEKLEILGFKVK